MPRKRKSSSKRKMKGHGAYKRNSSKKSSKKSSKMKGHGAYKRKSSSKRKTRGHGAYTTGTPWYKKVNSKKAGQIGSILGGLGGGLMGIGGGPAGILAGASGGAAAGNQIGSGIGHLFGNGSYHVQSNSVFKGGVPSFDSKGKHCFRFVNREYCFDITGNTSAFSNNTYRIQPSNTLLFPWFSGQSAGFQEYRIEGLVFEFKSLSGESVNSTNTTLGYVCLGTEYNATLPPFQNKIQLENSEFAVSGAPNRDMYHILECKRQETVLGELFIDSGGIPTGQDQRLYDFGILNIAVGNQQAGNVIGELHVVYDICCYKPITGNYSGSSVNGVHYTATSGISTSAYFGSSPALAAGSTFVASLGTATITFPNNMPLGNYQLTYAVVGSNTASVTPPTFSYTSNCKANAILNADATEKLVSNSATSTVTFITLFFIITGPSAVITLSSGTLPGSATSMDLTITGFPNQILT